MVSCFFLFFSFLFLCQQYVVTKNKFLVKSLQPCLKGYFLILQWAFD
uniref:Uncharacterized protein n=1 Tax=Rhizophora mucronata TaxID=61149 RepID=A0A2P2PSF7_RHIMU